MEAKPALSKKRLAFSGESGFQPINEASSPAESTPHVRLVERLNETARWVR